MTNVVAKVNLHLKIRSLKELRAMGIGDGAYLIEEKTYDTYLDFYQLEFDGTTMTKPSGKYSGFHLRDKTLRIPVECISFDFESFIDDNPEYFI